MFRNIFGCTSSSVQNQIAPISFQPGKYDDPESDNLDSASHSNNTSDGLRQKPKSEHSSISTKRHIIEDELFLFVLDLQVDEDSIFDLERFMLHSNRNLSCYSYENNELTLTSILVQILKNTVIKNPVAPAMTFQASRNSERKANLLFACKCLVQLLQDYQEYPKDFHSASPYNGNCFTCIEKALIVSVSPLILLTCNMTTYSPLLAHRTSSSRR